MSKKGGKQTKETASYDTREIVLGKVRGYPPWPGMVVDPVSVPGPVLKERPTTKKTQFYCVRFFPTGDYAWLVSKDISKLKPHEIQTYINEPNKKSGDLLQGYRIAQDPTKWEQEREAESRLAAEEEENAEVDQLDTDDASADGDADGDDDDSKTKKSRKRKRTSDDATSVKARKAPKKKDSGVDSKKKSTANKGGRKKKSNAMVESEEEEDADNVAADDDVGPSKKGSPPPAKRARRADKEEDGDDGQSSSQLHVSLNEAFEVLPPTSLQSRIASDPEALKVRDWRHKLQKTFLSHNRSPRAEDMPSIDALFTTVESYDKITIEYLQFSKIGKVMRHIAVLTDAKVPRDSEFKFRERAEQLVKKWQQILNANKSNGATASQPTSAAAPISAPVSKIDTEEKQEVVTQGTAAISLNGKPAEEPPTLPSEQPAPESVSLSAVVDTSVDAPADVVMTDAT